LVLIAAKNGRFIIILDFSY